MNGLNMIKNGENQKMEQYRKFADKSPFKKKCLELTFPVVSTWLIF